MRRLAICDAAIMLAFGACVLLGLMLGSELTARPSLGGQWLSGNSCYGPPPTCSGNAAACLGCTPTGLVSLCQSFYYGLCYWNYAACGGVDIWGTQCSCIYGSC